MKILSTIWEWIKKLWWLILLVIATMFGIKVLKNKYRNRDLEAFKKKVIKKQTQLEKDLEQLRKEAEKIEKSHNFDDSNSAINYLNKLLRRLQDNSEK